MQGEVTRIDKIDAGPFQGRLTQTQRRDRLILTNVRTHQQRCIKRFEIGELHTQPRHDRRCILRAEIGLAKTMINI